METTNKTSPLSLPPIDLALTLGNLSVTMASKKGKILSRMISGATKADRRANKSREAIFDS